MKKSILLGAAALAAVALAAPQAADAGEVKIGGYYQFRVVSTDNSVTDVAGDETANFWAQRLQLNVDMKASEKSHAHMVTRVLDNRIVQGSDQVFANAAAPAAAGPNAGVLGAADWQVRQLWLETEAWGVGLKVGNMPIALNDGLLVDNDVTSYGSILLAKNFGGVTVVAADVKVQEGVAAGNGTAGASYRAAAIAAGTATANQNDRDVDLYVLSALGKIDAFDYQLTGAYLKGEKFANQLVFPPAVPPVVGAPNFGALQDVSDGWIALTLSTKIQGIDLVGTAIYETGADSNLAPGAQETQLEKDGIFVGARAKGPTGFGGWNAYAFYGAADYTSPILGNNEAKWSSAWDSSGAGSQDLMQRALTGNAGNTTAGGANATGTGAVVGGYAGATGTFSNVSNMWGVGAGLTVNAGAWTIKPSLDYAHVVEDSATDSNNVKYIDANILSAWGGTLGFSTKIQEGTVLDLSGTWVNPKESAPVRTAGASIDTMHYLQASVKMDF